MTWYGFGIFISLALVIGYGLIYLAIEIPYRIRMNKRYKEVTSKWEKYT